MALALLLPFGVLVIQAAAWSLLQPFSWFLFLAGVFVSSWLGGLWGGLGATATSATLVWFFFLPPEHTFVKHAPKYFVALASFLTMGLLLSLLHDRLKRAHQATRTANDALRASEAKFAGILSIASDAIISIDEKQRIALYNEGAADTFGYTPEEVLGKPLTLLLPERFGKIHEQHVRSFAAGPDKARRMGERRPDIFGRRKSGEEFPAEAAISKLDLDGQRLFTVVLRDLTARRRLERELVQALGEQRFLAQLGELFASSLDYRETLTRAAQAAVAFMADFCIVDVVEEGSLQRLKVTHADPAQAEVAKALESSSVASGQPPLVWSALHSARSQLLAEVTSETAWADSPSEEHRPLTKAMEPKSVMFVPLVSQGRAIGVLSFVSSRPERRYGPADVRLAEQIAHRAALAIENARLYKLAQEALDARDELLGFVAHDLRNPLAVIQLTANLLLRQLPPESRERAARAVETIVRSSGHANRLIEDLLEIRKAQVGRLALRPDYIPAAKVLLDLAETQRPLLLAASLALKVDAPAELPAIWIDRDRITQVLENLIGNASKFTPAGGRVTLGARQRDGDILFWVSDTGPGIASDDLAHLFERFWQAHGAEQRGVGLGLAIAKQIIEAHHGRIWAESEPGKGASFFFTIPTSIPAADPLSALPSS